jgi:hypothetical protein
MMTVDAAVRARVEVFAKELAELVRESALEVVRAALGGDGGSPVRRGGARASSPRAAATGRSKGSKRDPKILAALTEKLGAFIKKNPGQRIEQIGKALGTATKELALPIKKLILAKEISTKGQRRATTYYGGRAGGSAKKPARAPKKARANTRAAAKGGRRVAKKAAPTAPPPEKAETSAPSN